MDALLTLVEQASFQPVMLLESGRPRDFCFMPITQYGTSVTAEAYSDFSALLDAFYTRRDKEESIRRRSRELTRTVKNTLERLMRKISAQENELLATRNKEEFRWKGDMITANLYRLEKGMASFTAQDYYHEPCLDVTIPIDPLKTPQQNAAAFYKAYTKARNAETMLARQLETERDEVHYLESVMDELSRAESEKDLGEIRRELTESGVLRARNDRKGRKVPQAKPLRFLSDSGFPILVGRNNLQNDELTTKTARRSDIWMHTKKFHGSHVILVCQDREPDELSLRQAASLAAYYSQAREAGRVAVDYTQVKYVKKPAGARPGMVVYTDYKTIPAVPDEALANRLSSP
jgi:predicted ribosome quality control (RQC) complex YloA/Tae2 family protein